MLQKKAPVGIEEQVLLSHNPDDEESWDVMGKFQAESPVKYEGRCWGKAGPLVLSAIDILWLIFNLYLFAQAVASVASVDQDAIKDVVKDNLGISGFNGTTVNLAPVISNAGWMGLLSLADAWALGWLIWAGYAGNANREAVAASKKGTTGTKAGLPYPPLLLSVTWSAFIFVLWSIALAGGVYYFFYITLLTNQEAIKIIGFIVIMFVIVVFAVMSSILGICRRTRDFGDMVLRFFGANCHDC
jgi:hypothetical protein